MTRKTPNVETFYAVKLGNVKLLKKESKERKKCEEQKGGCCAFGFRLSFTKNFVNSNVNLI